MKTRAVLVDGMGKTRDMVLHQEARYVRVPIVENGPALSDGAPVFSAVDFEYLGRLPDGRYVYAQSGIGFRLWSQQTVIDPLLLTVQEHAIAIARAEMRLQIEAMSRGMIVTLYDGQEVMDETNLLTIEMCGLAVPQETGATP